jgi:hypothetical protein
MSDPNSLTTLSASSKVESAIAVRFDRNNWEKVSGS